MALVMQVEFGRRRVPKGPDVLNGLVKCWENLQWKSGFSMVFHGLSGVPNFPIQIWLVVWNMAFMTFHILGITIPTDFHIFQRASNHQPEIFGVSL